MSFDNRTTTRMGRTFHVRSLRASEVRQAYPLIQLIVPCLTLEEWIRHVEALSTGGHGGIVSAHGEDGYIYGLLCYRIARELGRGRALVVEHLVALDMFDRSTAIQTLIGAVERIARDHHCAQVQLALPGARIELGKIDGSIHGSFGGAGYEVDSIKLCKRLTSEWHIGELAHEI